MRRTPGVVAAPAAAGMMAAMKLRHQLVYAAPPGAVFALMGDPDFRRAAATAQAAVSADVVHTPRERGFTLVIDRLQSTAGLPPFARAMAGSTTRAVQREDWVDAHGASLDIEMPGKPVTAAGTITLRAEGTGTRAVIELDITIQVPWVGGRLEKLVGAQIAAGMDAEHALGVRHLEEHR